MNKKYQNAFFIFGLAVLAVMTANLDFAEVWAGLRHAGYWTVAVVMLWAFLYIFNTAAWYIIIKSQETKQNNIKQDSKIKQDSCIQQDCNIQQNSRIQQDCNIKQDRKLQHPFGFAWLYKITVSGFALNYATPGGLMGGEPYKIMSLAPYIGTERATSSVILHTMTHIFSHFWFWLLSVVLYVATQTLTLPLCIMLACITLFCALGLWFFMAGYRKGIAVRVMNIARHIPLIRKRAEKFVDSHSRQLATIDSQIASLHAQNPRTFVTAVLLELACRICSAAEIMFVLLVLTPIVSYTDCILILAFTSLFANLLFFIPLQLGGREGGFLMSATGLSMSAGAGIFVALIVRVRELIWTAIGLLLIKFSAKIADN